MAQDMDEREEQDEKDDLKDTDMPDEADVKDGEEAGTFRCPYCGEEVNEDAIRCPKCQRYVSAEDAKPHRARGLIFLLVLLAIVGLIIWALVK
jgi:predicted RNA-binding Zn-ribbon protein involved in translation (DUF1610 family)